MNEETYEALIELGIEHIKDLEAQVDAAYQDFKDIADLHYGTMETLVNFLGIEEWPEDREVSDAVVEAVYLRCSPTQNSDFNDALVTIGQVYTSLLSHDLFVRVHIQEELCALRGLLARLLGLSEQEVQEAHEQKATQLRRKKSMQEKKEVS